MYSVLVHCPCSVGQSDQASVLGNTTPGNLAEITSVASAARNQDMWKVWSYHTKKKHRIRCCLCVTCYRRHGETVLSFVAVDHTRVPKAMSQSWRCSYERREKTSGGENGLKHSDSVVPQADLARRHYLGAISLQARVAFVATLQHGR